MSETRQRIGGGWKKKNEATGNEFYTVPVKLPELKKVFAGFPPEAENFTIYVNVWDVKPKETSPDISLTLDVDTYVKKEK